MNKDKYYVQDPDCGCWIRMTIDEYNEWKKQKEGN